MIDIIITIVFMFIDAQSIDIKELQHKAAIAQEEQYHGFVERTGEFIANFEGFVPCPYPDGNSWSVGYGQLAKNTDCISEKKDRENLHKEIMRIHDLIDAAYPHLNNNQKAAIISFTYNTPQTKPALNKKSCVIAIKNENSKLLANCFANHAWLSGLKKRRDAELQLFTQ